MTIARLKHVSLVGLAARKQEVLEALQDLGVAHITPVDRPAVPLGDAAAAEAARSRRALRFLQAARYRWHQSHHARDFNASRVAGRALEIDSRMRAAVEEREALRQRIRALEPWGDFDLAADDPPDVRFWFYILANHRLRALAGLTHCWQVVRRDARFSHVVVIAATEPVGVPAARTHAGPRGLARLRDRLEAVELELDELETERSREARWCDLLSASLDRLEDEAMLRHALQATHDEAPFFAVSAWIPAGAIPAVGDLATRHSLAWVSRNPAPDEDPPTLLENRGFAAFGQDLLRFYQLPRYDGWDPSAPIFWFFAAFFAVIIADAGYALLLVAGVAAFWRRLGSSESGRRGRRLAMVATATAVAWGAAIGSWFGVPPAAGSWLGTLHVVDVSDTRSYVTIAVVIGALQLAFANGAMAWHTRDRRALANIGWIAVIAGALGFWLMPATREGWTPFGPAGWLAVGGLALVAVYTSPLRPVPARAADGALALIRTVSLFSDVLSYLRLFALGYAGGALAGAFNDLASRIEQAQPGIGILAAALVLAIGHGLNLGLSVASAVVHGLRLNLIEFLNWSVAGEGRPFQHFERKENRAWRIRSA